jgi:hypothetical protein
MSTSNGRGQPPTTTPIDPDALERARRWVQRLLASDERAGGTVRVGGTDTKETTPAPRGAEARLAEMKAEHARLVRAWSEVWPEATDVPEAEVERLEAEIERLKAEIERLKAGLGPEERLAEVKAEHARLTSFWAAATGAVRDSVRDIVKALIERLGAEIKRLEAEAGR